MRRGTQFHRRKFVDVVRARAEKCTVAKAVKRGKYQHSRQRIHKETEAQTFCRHQNRRKHDEVFHLDMAAQAADEEQKRDFHHGTHGENEPKIDGINLNIRHVIRQKVPFKRRGHLEEECKNEKRHVCVVFQQYTGTRCALFHPLAALRLKAEIRQYNGGNHHNAHHPECRRHTRRRNERVYRDNTGNGK